MNIEQVIVASASFLFLIGITYHLTGWNNIRECYKMWLTKEYWRHSYNIVEALSWFAKAIIIIPGLIFGIQIWQLYFLTLVTSLTLIWASNKKLLPTLVAFNTMWAWLSLMVIAQRIV
jgi:hypothetical protein